MADNPFAPKPAASGNPFARRPSPGGAGNAVAKRPQPERSWGEAAVDTGLAVLKGATNLLGAAATNHELLNPGDNLPRLANKAIEAAGGAPDFLPTPASMGLPSRATLANKAGEALDSAQSGALQARKQELADTDGFFASAKKVVTDPALLGNFAAEQVPTLALMGGGAGVAASRAGGVALEGALARGVAPLAARPIARAAGQQAAERFLVGANVGIEGGSAAQQAYIDTLNLPQETWDKNPDYQAMVARGVSPNSAKEELARGAGRTAMAIAAPVAGVAGKFAAPFEAQVFTRALPRSVGHVAGGIGREATEEAIQEGASQMASNLGVQQVDASRGAFEGVPEAAGTGGALGAFLGGGMATVGAATSRAGRPQPRTAPPPLPPAQPAAAPTPAPMLALPPPGAVSVDGEGNSATEAQQDPLRRAAVDALREREGLGLTTDVNRARAQHPGAIPNSRPIPQVFPGAAPGSLADAVNAMAERPRPQLRPLSEPAQAQSGPPPLPLPQTGPPPLPAAAGQVAPAAAAPPRLPWIDDSTGERLDPTREQIEGYIHDQFNLQIGAGRGVNTAVVKRALQGDGLKPSVISQALSKVQRDRKAGLTAPAAVPPPLPAAEPTAAQTRAELDAAAAPAARQSSPAPDLPRQDVGETTGWLNANAQASRDIADQRGLTERIESEFAQGKTAKQVQNTLDLDFLPPEERAGFVVNVRATLGIPSQMDADGKGEFAAWKAARDERAAQVSQAAPAAPAPAAPAQLPSARADVLQQIRTSDAVTPEHVAALGAKPSVDAANAARLYAEVLGAEQSVGRKALAQIPAGADGRRDTVSVLEAARNASAGRAAAAPSSSTAPGLSAEAPAEPAPPAPAGGAATDPAVTPATPAAQTAAKPPKKAAAAAKRAAGPPASSAAVAAASADATGDVDIEETRRGLQVDRADRDALRAALAADVSPVDGKPLQSEGFRRQYQDELANLETAVSNAESYLAKHDRASGRGQQPAPAPEPAPADSLRRAAAEAATSPENDRPEPTEAQKEAGNYKKGHARIAGLDVSIENPAGTKRRPEWPALKHHYGYFKGTVGRDKDHVDVFLTDQAHDESRPVFVIDQVDKKGKFDEHKVVMGAADEAEARATYLANYEKGWTGLGGITRMSQEQFRAWVRDPAKTMRKLSRARRAPAAAPVPAPAPAPAAPSGGAADAKTPSAGLFSKAGRAGSDRSPWSGFPAAVIADPFGPNQRRPSAHPDYAAAKAGDVPAAARLAREYVDQGLVDRLRAVIGDRTPVLVPVLAQEATGRNKIPQAYAYALGSAMGLDVSDDIVQTVRALHTGARAFHRLAFQPVFEGPVVAGQDYVIVDDAITMAGTLANLRGHIEANGGRVVAATVLTGHPSGATMALQPATAKRLQETFGDDLDTFLRDEFGFDSSHLTEGEAGHILGARSLDVVRDRIAQARDEAERAAAERGLSSKPDPAEGAEAGRLNLARAQGLKGQLTAKWGENAPAIVLVQDAEGFPSTAKVDPDYRRGEGFYDGRPTVWLNLAQLRTEKRFGEVLAHEAIGHYGVEQVVGKAEWTGIVDSIEKLERAGGGSTALRSVFEDVRRRQPGLDRVGFAKEAIAFMAERGIRNSFVGRVVAAVRRFLRRVMPSLAWSEADVRNLLGQADSFLRAGRGAAARAETVRAYSFSQAQASADPFYSALLQSAEAAKGAPKSAGPQQWREWLDGAQRRGEFKPEERAWLGLDDWLEGQQGVTRQQLVDYIRANQVQIRESFTPSTDSDALFEELFELGYSVDQDEYYGTELYFGGEPVDVDAAPKRVREIVDALTSEHETEYSKYTLPGGRNYRELLLQLPENDGAFQSSHFKEGNVVAHVRFNERMSDDGQRTLFVEEIQSDWHQAGRRRGYKDASAERGRLTADESVRLLQLERGIQRGEDDAVFVEEAQALRARDDAYRAYARTPGVPDAPFKTTWPQLAFRRMVRYAAEHGFDRVAWTTGEQQSERFQLSHSLDAIDWSREAGQYRLRPVKDGVQVFATQIDARLWPAAELESVVGKDVASKIVAAADAGAEKGRIDKANLTVGGEGMKGFYDRMLPTEVKKWAKRFGGTVGTTKIDGVDQHSLEVTPAMVKGALGGQPLFSKVEADPYDVATEIGVVMRQATQYSAPLVERARAALGRLVPKKVKDATRPAWQGALTTRHLTELGGDYFPSMPEYSDRLAMMAADRNELQAASEEIAEGVRKWAGKNRAAAQELFELMHDATIDGVDPAEAYQAGVLPEFSGQRLPATKKNLKEFIKAQREVMRGRGGDSKVDRMEAIKAARATVAAESRRAAAYPTLVERWNRLSPEAKTIYRQFRDAYLEHSKMVEEALVARINALQKTEAGKDIGENQRQAMIYTIRQQFESQRLQGVYFPLQRFGEYFVAAEKDGTPAYLMFERLDQLEAAVKDLRARGYRVKAQGKKDAAKAKDAPSGTFLHDILQKMQQAGVSEKTQDEVYQVYLQALPELSMRKHSIHRKSVAGFDPDALRAFSYNMHHSAHQIARLRHSHQLQQIIETLQVQQDNARQGEGADTRRITAGDAILSELRRRHEWISNPQDSAVTNLISSAGFVYYLGLTPAAALVNLTQTAMVTYPFLASRHGAVKAMNYLLAASRDAGRTFGNIQRTLTDPDEQRAHATLQKMGALDKTQAHNLAGIAEGGLAGYNPAWARAMEIIGWGFHKTEVINREATGLAAFRLAKADGQSFDEAVKFAADAINDTHFDYSNANRARFMQSGTAKVLLMFRQYGLNMTWHLGRMLWQATKGEKPEVRKIARRNLVGLLGMSSIFSGVLGLPTIGVVTGLANALQASFGDDDEPWDAETEMRAYMSGLLGPTATATILRGPVNQVTGADIAGRVGLSDLWFRDADRELEGRGAYYNLLEQAAGPMGGVLKNALVGKKLIDDGHLWRGVETMLPKSLKDMMKGARYAREGVNTLRGDPLINDGTLYDTLLQLNGFTSNKVSERYQRNNALKNYEQALLDRRGHLMDSLAMAYRTGDDTAAVLAKIRAFNQANPAIAITNTSIIRSLGARARYSAKAEGGVVLNARLAAQVKAAVGD